MPASDTHWTCGSLPSLLPPSHTDSLTTHTNVQSRRHRHQPILAQTSARDFAVWLTSFVCTLFLGVERGIAVSATLSLLIVIAESAFPRVVILGQVDGTSAYK